MSGISFEIDATQVGIAADKLDQLANFERHELLDMLGGLVAEQTKERIATEKTSPDGAPWKANRRGGSTLVLEGNLLGSIDHHVSSSKAEIGSPLIYAAIHHYGGTIKAKSGKKLAFGVGNQMYFMDSVDIPARPYLGLSAANLRELENELGDWIEGTLQ